MSTKIYGASDDLIEFEGDIKGETNSYAVTEEDPVVVIVDDGTLFTIFYSNSGIWKINILKKGKCFDHLDICDDPDAEVYSDVLYLKAGAKRAWTASNISEVN